MSSFFANLIVEILLINLNRLVNPRGFHFPLRHLHGIITSLLLQLTWTIPQSHRSIIKSTPVPLSGCRILLNSTAKRPVRESQRPVFV